jgi:hypothetical protein
MPEEWKKSILVSSRIKEIFKIVVITEELSL